MYTNEFNQTIKADWILISLTAEDLAGLAQVVLRTLVKGEEIQVEVIDNEKVVEIRYSALSEDAIATIDEHTRGAGSTTSQIIKWIFGETSEFFDFGSEEQILIRVEFDSYIKRVHGL